MSEREAVQCRQCGSSSNTAKLRPAPEGAPQGEAYGCGARCGKALVTRSGLYQHRKVHTGERPLRVWPVREDLHYQVLPQPPPALPHTERARRARVRSRSSTADPPSSTREKSSTAGRP